MSDDNFSHRADYSLPSPLLIAMWRARTGSTLAAGEGELLVQEIERLEAERNHYAAACTEWTHAQLQNNADMNDLRARAERAEAERDEAVAQEQMAWAAFHELEAQRDEAYAEVRVAKRELEVTTALCARAERAEAVLARLREPSDGVRLAAHLAPARAINEYWYWVRVFTASIAAAEAEVGL